MLPTPRLVPWSSWSEWRAVYAAVESVASGGVAGMQVLLDAHASWAQRGRAPLAAASTLALLVRLRAAEADSGALGLLIVRLVNGVADGGQNGSFAASVADIARRVGFPRWIVDLRHELTHGVAPDVRVLRLAAAHAVAWMLERYWRPQMAALYAFSGESERAAVAALLSAVPAARLEDLLEGTPAKRRASSGRAAATTLIEQARLVTFSARASRAVAAACDGDAARLVVDPAACANARKSLLQITATAGYAALVDAAFPQPCAALMALVEAAASRLDSRFDWIQATLIDALVRGAAGILKKDSDDGSALAHSPAARALLPPTHAHAERAFRTWLPLLFSIEVAVPGFARLLLRALVAPDVNGALAEAWVMLLRSRYWASLADWSLAVAPRRYAEGRRSTAHTGECTHVILHERRSWTREEASWAFSEAPAASLLGLEQAASGQVTIDFNKSFAHFLPAASDSTPFRTMAGTSRYAAALHAPPQFARVLDSPLQDDVPAERKKSWDLAEFERLVQSGDAAVAPIQPVEVKPLPKRPRWTL
jgi:hypothetical protein